MESKGRPAIEGFVTFNIRSIISVDSSGTPKYRNKHEVVIDIPEGYPFSASPSAKMAKGYLPIFHPNFYSSGTICTQTGKWTPNETLTLFVIRLAKMFRFDADMTDPGNPANSRAARWYEANLKRGLFPTDNRPLPTLGGDEDDFDVDFEVVTIRR